MLRKPIVDDRPTARPTTFIILITSFPLENLVNKYLIFVLHQVYCKQSAWPSG